MFILANKKEKTKQKNYNLYIIYYILWSVHDKFTLKQNLETHFVLSNPFTMQILSRSNLSINSNTSVFYICTSKKLLKK